MHPGVLCTSVNISYPYISISPSRARQRLQLVACDPYSTSLVLENTLRGVPSWVKSQIDCTVCERKKIPWFCSLEFQGCEVRGR